MIDHRKLSKNKTKQKVGGYIIQTTAQIYLDIFIG